MNDPAKAIQSFHDQYLMHLGDIINLMPIGGGSINQTFKLVTLHQTFFVKVNDAEQFPDLFDCEFRGLHEIAAVIPDYVPNVICFGEEDDSQLLFMEWIEPGGSTEYSSQEAGRVLATLHRHSREKFGLEYDNYMGSLRQINKECNSFAEFYTENRILPQVKMSVDKGLINKDKIKAFEKFCSKIDELIPKEPASLIHGDLWRGNLLHSRDEKPYLIDPAISYSHRETDLAMLRLFGRPSDALFEMYEDEFPTAPGRLDRERYFQLYPLLIHLNLFGMGYYDDVINIVKPFN
ncbi:MAG: fructosamine kinase family protein [Flavobacteriales bacterium]